MPPEAFDDDRGMTEEEHGRALAGIICDTAARVASQGGQCNTCVVTPREMAAMVRWLNCHVFYVDRRMDDGRVLHGLRIGAFTDVFARGDCPPGRLVVGGPELLT